MATTLLYHFTLSVWKSSNGFGPGYYWVLSGLHIHMGNGQESTRERAVAAGHKCLTDYLATYTDPKEQDNER